MAYDKLHIIITFLGALVMAVFSYFNEDSMYMFSVRLLIAIVVFFILGLTIRTYLRSKFPPEEAEPETDDTEEGENEDEALTNDTEGELAEDTDFEDNESNGE